MSVGPPEGSPGRTPRSLNPFSADPEALDDEELRDRAGIYRALLARLDGGEPSVLRTREQVAEALAELEAEAARRGRGSDGAGG